MAHQKTKVEKDTSERWLLTYSDLMNLLLILFIILYAMSQVDTTKYEQLSNSLKEAFGASSSSGQLLQGGNVVIPMDGSASTVIPANVEQEQMEAIQEKVADIVEKEGLQGNVAVSIEERGVVISIKEKVLFKSGSADIEPESLPTIEKIGKVLLAIPGKSIRIEGHTDTDPIITSRFPDNQELSTARANSVWRILVKAVGIDPKTISATGYGEFRPIVPNDTEAHKAQNRRVDIAILKSSLDKSEAGNSNVQTTGN